MKKVGGLVGLVLALGIGYFIFRAQMTTGPTGGAPPQQVIDTTGVENDLVAPGRAGEMSVPSHGIIGSLDRPNQDGMTLFSDGPRRGSKYTVDFNDGKNFHVTATPSAPAKKNWPTVSIDETMRISKQ